MYSNVRNRPSSIGRTSAMSTAPPKASLIRSASATIANSALTHCTCESRRWLLGPPATESCQGMSSSLNRPSAPSRTSGRRLCDGELDREAERVGDVVLLVDARAPGPRRAASGCAASRPSRACCASLAYGLVFRGSSPVSDVRWFSDSFTRAVCRTPPTETCLGIPRDPASGPSARRGRTTPSRATRHGISNIQVLKMCISYFRVCGRRPPLPATATQKGRLADRR